MEVKVIYRNGYYFAWLVVDNRWQVELAADSISEHDALLEARHKLIQLRDSITEKLTGSC